MRYLGAVCRLCRRENVKLFLKGERCLRRCALERRPQVPGGAKSKRTLKLSDYGKHLREKQKARRILDVGESQFRRYFHLSERLKGITGENLVRLLELRLDSVLYRANFALSRHMARQFVRHAKVKVNGRKVNIPSYELNVGDIIEIRESFRDNVMLAKAVEFAKKQTDIPEWLEVDWEKCLIKVMRLPLKEEFSIPVNEQSIVELYSK